MLQVRVLTTQLTRRQAAEKRKAKKKAPAKKKSVSKAVPKTVEGRLKAKSVEDLRKMAKFYNADVGIPNAGSASKSELVKMMMSARNDKPFRLAKYA